MTRDAREPAILLGLYYSSLQVAQSLGRKGIPVYGIDFEREVGRHSRYIETLDAPRGGAELRDFLVSFARRLGTRLVLYPLADEYVGFLVEHAETLAPHLAFPEPPAGVVRALLDKTASSQLLERLDADHPRTLAVRKGTLAPAELGGLRYPVIIKPRYKQDWLDHPVIRSRLGDGQLVVTAPSAEEAAREIAFLGSVSDFVVQEFVPGTSEAHYYYVGYRDRLGRIATSYIGQKLRTLPDCLGSETLLRSVHIPELLQRGDAMLDRADYRGPAGIDFKRDPRDGVFKVIEINCRIGINDCYLVKYGVDLPYIYYLDSLGREVHPAREYPDGVTWYDPFRDFEWMRLYRKRTGMGWLPWITKLGSYDTYAVFSRLDPGPAMTSIFGLFRRVARKLGHAGRLASGISMR
jgi:D-aspartate ligase